MPEHMNRLIVALVDRSGSMHSIREDTEGGLSAFIADQSKEFPDTHMALHQFDTVYETVYEPTLIADVPAYKLNPRGGTALLDAIGDTIHNTKHAVKTASHEDHRPQVVMVIVTDGLENQSTRYTLDKIKKMIEKRTAKGWTFVYLGANQDAIQVGASLGIARDTSMTYDGANTKDMFASVSGLVSRGTHGAGYSFTDAERDKSVS